MSEVTSIHSLAQTVTAGAVLFEEGTAGGGMVILLSGRLDVYRGGIKVGSITEPGSYVGESTVLTGNQRSATVVAESSATIIKLSAPQALAFLQEREMEGKVLRNLVERLETANNQMVEKQGRLAEHRESMTELLTSLRNLYTEMDKAEASQDAYYEAMRSLRRVINTYGTGRFTKGRIQI
jgi:CRP-like cAMP-binding protein